MTQQSTTAAEPIRQVSPTEIDYLLSACVVIPDVFSAAADKLLPEHFSPAGEIHYAVFWRALLELAKAHSGRLPAEGTVQLVYTEVLTLAERDLRGQYPEVYSLLVGHGGILYLATSYYDRSKINRVHAFHLLSRFLHERRIVRRLQAMAAEGNNPELLKNLGELHTEAAKVAHLGTTEVRVAKHQRSDKEVTPLTKTGITFLDDRLNGGVLPGGIYSILGPTGVGKTLLMTSVCVESAIKEQLRHDQCERDFGVGSSKLGYFYYFTYEGAHEHASAEITRRFVAYLAKIDMTSRLLQYESNPEFQFAGPNDPPPDYENRVFKDGIDPEYGTKALCEIERYSNANNIISRNIRIVEMVPSPDNPRRGSGYVDEIQSVLLSEKEAGREPVGYYIDYAKVMAKNHVGTNLKDIRHYVGGLPMACIKYLNSYLPRAHGWIANQFNTEGNRRAATWVPHHSYSGEAGDFGENCWFAFCLGTRDSDDNCCILNCSKHRGAPPMRPTTLYIHGGINRMICMDGKIDLDQSTRQFSHREAFERDADGRLIVHLQQQRKKA